MTHIDLTHEDLNILLEAQDDMTAKQQHQLNLRLHRTDNDTWRTKLSASKADKLISALQTFSTSASAQQRKQAEALADKLAIVNNNETTMTHGVHKE